jgi:catechol 2,3-dioxygenase-like lactoylglutathione lyase family enzyme
MLFYTQVLGLTVGARPKIPAPGYWLYSNGQAIVHLYAIGETKEISTGPLDHIAFSASDLDQMRKSLTTIGIPYEEAPVPDWPLHQVFLHDPAGLKVELTFSLEKQ